VATEQCTAAGKAAAPRQDALNLPTHYSRHRKGEKLWCHLYLDTEMLKPGFDLNKKIIGHGGNCTKAIYEATGCKIRLRGRGSGHFEGAREAPVHLMLAVTTDAGLHQNFRKAFEMSADLLRSVEKRFRSFCQKGQEEEPSDPCFWVGELSVESQASLGSALEGFPLPQAGKKAFRRNH